MIIGDLGNIKEEKYVYPKAIQLGLEFLLDKSNYEKDCGIYYIKDKEIFAKISEYNTEPIRERHPEQHKQYIDIQCIVAGVEKIGVGRGDMKNIFSDKLLEKDVIYYNKIQNEQYIDLHPGTFIVCFPWDAHRPNCNYKDTVERVKKILIKIDINLLKLGKD